MPNPANNLVNKKVPIASNTRSKASNNKPKIMEELNDTLQKVVKQFAMPQRLVLFDGENNVTDFLEDFDRYVRSGSINTDQEKLDALINSVDHKAKEWFRLQSPETKGSYERLRAALKERFTLSTQERHTAVAGLFQEKQQLYETVQDFVYKVQRKSRHLGMTEDAIVGVIIAGVRPSLRRHLQMSQPETIEDILKSPAATADFEADEPQQQAMALITEKIISEVTTQLAKNHLAPVQVQAIATEQTSSSVGEKHVSFQGHRSRSKERGGQQNGRPRSKTPIQGAQKTQQQPYQQFQMPYQQPYQQSYHQQAHYNQQVPYQQMVYPQPPMQYQQQAPNYTFPRQKHQTGSKCKKCASSRCQGGTNCFAYDKTCFNCGKEGHIKIACFQTKNDARQMGYQQFGYYNQNNY